MDRDQQFGQRLRRLREDRGQSQRELAEGLVTPSYISLLESGRRLPTLDVILHLARTLGVSVAELVGDDPREAADGWTQEWILLRETLANAPTTTEAYAEAVTAALSALDDARDAGKETRFLEVGFELQKALSRLHRHDDRLRILDELAESPAVAASTEFRVVVLTDRASTWCQLGRHAAAAAMAEQAASLIAGSRLEGGAQHVALLGVLVSALVAMRDPVGVTRVLDQLLEITQIQADQALAGRGHLIAAVAHARLGRTRLAAEHLAAAHDAGVGSIPFVTDWLRFCRMTASVLLDADGDPAEAHDWLRSAELCCRMVGQPEEERALTTALRARLHLVTNDPDASLTHAEQLLTQPGSLPYHELLSVHITAAHAMARLGRPEDALTRLRELAIQTEELGYEMALTVWHAIDEIQAGT